jgi:hypothetical protein
MRRFFASAVLLGSLLAVGFVDAQTGTSPGKSPAPAPKTPGVIQLRPGVAAPDFPPGIFTDGGHYSMEDFKGKVLALYFFEAG